MQSQAATVDKYLAELPPERRTALEAVRRVILQNLGDGFEEGMQYGLIGYYVPHSIYPAGYHCDPRQPLPFVCLASQNNDMSPYLGCVSEDAATGEWFHQAWKKSGKKLDMGKSCLRFKRLNDLALDVIGEAIRRFTLEKQIACYEAAIAPNVLRKAAKKPATNSAGRTAKQTPRKAAAKKPRKR